MLLIQHIQILLDLFQAHAILALHLLFFSLELVEFLLDLVLGHKVFAHFVFQLLLFFLCLCDLGFVFLLGLEDLLGYLGHLLLLFVLAMLLTEHLELLTEAAVAVLEV